MKNKSENTEQIEREHDADLDTEIENQENLSESEDLDDQDDLDSLLQNPKIQELINKEVEGLKKKNIQLIKKLKKTKESLPNEDEDDSNKDDSKLHDVKIKSLEDKLKQQNEEIRNKQEKLNQIVIDSQIKKSLLENDVDVAFHDALVTWIRTKNDISIEEEDNGDLIGIIGDKYIQDYVKDFLSSENGHKYRTRNLSRGSGSKTQKSSSSNSLKKSKMSKTDKVRYIKEHGADEYNNLPD